MPTSLCKLHLGLWLRDADHMGGPPKGMNEGFPKEESGEGRGAKRVVGLGMWERIVSSLVTSLGEGGLLAGLGAVSLLRSRAKTTWQSVACDGGAGEGTGMMLGWRWVVMLRGSHVGWKGVCQRESVVKIFAAQFGSRGGHLYGRACILSFCGWHRTGSC